MIDPDFRKSDALIQSAVFAIFWAIMMYMQAFSNAQIKAIKIENAARFEVLSKELQTIKDRHEQQEQWFRAFTVSHVGQESARKLMLDVGLDPPDLGEKQAEEK